MRERVRVRACLLVSVRVMMVFPKKSFGEKTPKINFYDDAILCIDKNRWRSIKSKPSWLSWQSVGLICSEYLSQISIFTHSVGSALQLYPKVTSSSLVEGNDSFFLFQIIAKNDFGYLQCAPNNSEQYHIN